MQFLGAALPFIYHVLIIIMVDADMLVRAFFDKDDNDQVGLDILCLQWILQIHIVFIFNYVINI